MQIIINFILIFSIFLFFIYGTLKSAKKESLVSTYFVFALLSIIYFTLIPIEIWLTNVDGFYSNTGFIYVKPYITNILFQTLLSLLLFYIGLIFPSVFNFKYPPPLSANNIITRINISASTFRLIIITSLFILYFKNELISSALSYTDVASIAYGSPIFAIGKYVLCLIFGFFSIISYKQQQKISFLLYAILPIIFGALTHDKNLILITILVFTIIFSDKIKNPIRATIYLMISVPLIIILLYLVYVFSFWRAGIDFSQSLNLAKEAFSFTKIDPAGPMRSIIYYFGNEEIKFGFTYINNFLYLIPNFLYPERPLSLPDVFAQSQLTAWEVGQGLGFSPLAEAYINFHNFAFIYFFFLGIFWKNFWCITRYYFAKILPAFYFSIYYKIFGFYLLIISFRVDSLHIIKITPFYIVVSIVLLFIICKKSNYAEKCTMDT